MSNVETERDLNESNDELVISLENYNEGIDEMSKVSNNELKKVMCSVCKEVFNEKVLFDAHLRNVSAMHRNRGFSISVNDKRLFGCNKCIQVFDNKVDLYEHLRVVHMKHVVTADLSAFKKCSKCEMVFIDKHSLEDHMRLNHPEVMTIDGIGELEILSSGNLRQSQLDKVFDLEVNVDQKRDNDAYLPDNISRKTGLTVTNTHGTIFAFSRFRIVICKNDFRKKFGAKTQK